MEIFKPISNWGGGGGGGERERERREREREKGEHVCTPQTIYTHTNHYQPLLTNAMTFTILSIHGDHCQRLLKIELRGTRTWSGRAAVSVWRPPH